MKSYGRVRREFFEAQRNVIELIDTTRGLRRYSGNNAYVLRFVPDESRTTWDDRITHELSAIISNIHHGAVSFRTARISYDRCLASTADLTRHAFNAAYPTAIRPALILCEGSFESALHAERELAHLLDEARHSPVFRAIEKEAQYEITTHAQALQKINDNLHRYTSRSMNATSNLRRDIQQFYIS